MAVLLTDIPEVSPPPMPMRKRWTRAEFHALEASDAFQWQHLELVNGELISKIGKNRRHSLALQRMMVWLQEIFGSGVVEPETPIDVIPGDNPTSEPEPDLIVLNKPSIDIATGNPGPKDISLLVEISDTSLHFDLSTKALLYARAGILEYWVLDVIGRRLVVHRHPENGRYTSVMIYNEDETLAPLAAPSARFTPVEALPIT